jgi:uncharacterized protein involved in outer membrane biogenesis
MRIVAKVIGLVVGSVVVIAAVVFLFFDANQLRGTIQAQLEAGLKRKVSLGAIRLGFFPPALRVQDVSVGENPPLLRAKEFAVQAALWPLLRKQVQVRSLRLLEPVVEIVETSEGHWNYETPGGAGGGALPAIAELIATDGQVGVTALGKPRQLYEHIDLRLNDFAPGSTFNAIVAMQLPQSLNLKVAMKGRGFGDGFNFQSLVADLGKLHLAGSGRWSESNTDLALKVDRASIVELAQAGAALGFAFSPGAEVTGDIAADLRITGPSAHLAYSGRADLTALQVRESGQSPPVRIPAVRLEITPNEIRTNTFAVESGATRLAASALVTGYALPDGAYQIKLNTPSAELGELLRIASSMAPPSAAIKGVKGTGHVSLDMTLRGKMESKAALQFAGTATLDEASIRVPGNVQPILVDNADLQFRGADAATGMLSVGRLVANGVTLSAVQATCGLKDGVVTLDPLVADVAGGHQVGSLVIDTRGATTAYALRTRMEHADANQVLSSTTSLKQIVFGLLTADADVRFAARPGEELAKSMGGTFGLKLADGKLAGVNLVNEMAGIAKLLGFRKQGEAVTNILGLTGNWAITNGVAETRDLKMAFDGGSLTAAGTVNLATQAIQMKLTTTMTRAFADQFTGNRIGGLLTTALTNKNGEIVIPANVSGSLAKPMFTPDAAEMARLRVQSVVPSASEAASKIGGAVEAIRKDGAKGLLDIFKKKQ